MREIFMIPVWIS